MRIGEKVDLGELVEEIVVYVGQYAPGKPELRGVDSGRRYVLSEFPSDDVELVVEHLIEPTKPRGGSRAPRVVVTKKKRRVSKPLPDGAEQANA